MKAKNEEIGRKKAVRQMEQGVVKQDFSYGNGNRKRNTGNKIKKFQISY